MRYSVISCRTEWFQDEIEAESEDEARDIWEISIMDDMDLYAIEDEDGHQTLYI